MPVQKVGAVLVATGAGTAAAMLPDAFKHPETLHMEAASACGQLLQLLEPEIAHQVAMFLATYGLIPSDRRLDDPRLGIQLWGRSFSNPLGIAAGMDKDAEAMEALMAMGLGFMEVGAASASWQARQLHPPNCTIWHAISLNNQVTMRNVLSVPVTVSAVIAETTAALVWPWPEGCEHDLLRYQQSSLQLLQECAAENPTALQGRRPKFSAMLCWLPPIDASTSHENAPVINGFAFICLAPLNT
jgi:hypothetical protein